MGVRPTPQVLSGLVLDVEGRLDQPITLASLAKDQGVSPFHFHRKVQQVLGETPSRLVERMRLERAAYLLAGPSGSVLSIALEVGYRAPETFARAFRRMFGRSPSAYRRLAWGNQQTRLVTNLGFRGDGCVLSEVRFVRLPAMRLAAVRRLGAYSSPMAQPFSAEDALWSRVLAWAEARALAPQKLPIMICLDDPTVTPGPLQRLDACLPVARGAAADGDLRVIDFAGGWYALIEHEGPGETLIQAYRGCADGIRLSSDFEFGPGPPIEFLRPYDGRPDQALTEVCFPVLRKKRQARRKRGR